MYKFPCKTCGLTVERCNNNSNARCYDCRTEESRANSKKYSHSAKYKKKAREIYIRKRNELRAIRDAVKEKRMTETRLLQKLIPKENLGLSKIGYGAYFLNGQLVRTK